MLTFKNYKPRIIFIFLLFLTFFAIIITRLYLLQIKQQTTYQSIAKSQYTIDIMQIPTRAVILDRYNTPLTINRESTSAFILPYQLVEPEKTLKILKKHFPLSYEKLKKEKDKHFIWLKRKLSEEEINKIKNLNSKDIHFLKEPERFYPFKHMAQIIGITNIDNKGIAGIELEFDQRLAGKPTKIRLERDARSNLFYFEKEIKQKGQKGAPVKLTIDSKLQFLVYEELKECVKNFEAKSASAIIMNPKTGEILAMSNYPSFSPNNIKNLNLELIKNKAVTDCHELGSVMKIFSALAALQEKVVTLDEEIDCGGKFAYFGKFKVENWKSVGIATFKDVVRYSSNVGIAKVAQRIGPKLYSHLIQLGFGSKTHIRFPGEREGFVNPPSNWSSSSLIVMSFGYEIMATLLQLTRALSVIANGGYQIQPILISDPPPTPNTIRQKIYDEDAIKDTKEIMEEIGKRYLSLEGYRIMGKTGTARISIGGKYSNKEHVYTFGGIIEKENYSRVITTLVVKPQNPSLWASQVTAPLFAKIAEKTIIYDLLNTSK